MKVAFAKGEVVEVVRPFWMDGEVMEVGQLIEMPEREAREFKARRQVRAPIEQPAKGASKGKAA